MRLTVYRGDKRTMKIDWIFSSQQEAVLKKYPGPVVWVNQCKRCGIEEPVYQGPLDVAIYQLRKFISIHRGCREKRTNS
jgi:predicted nucleotidyltransferase